MRRGPGTDAYAGYLMAGAGFLALAHTFRRGEHIRVTLLAQALPPRARESIDKLRANGMQILPPSDQLKANMAKVGETMLKEWLEKAGAEGKAVIDGFGK